MENITEKLMGLLDTWSGNLDQAFDELLFKFKANPKVFYILGGIVLLSKILKMNIKINK